ncbi:MAG: hypothetical protein IKP51_03480 [Treponema sp.]|nr:hypothetical protein [Treponema sp.]
MKRKIRIIFILATLLPLALISCATNSGSAERKPSKIIKNENVKLDGSKELCKQIVDTYLGVQKKQKLMLCLYDKDGNSLGNLTVKTDNEGYIFIKNLPDNFESVQIKDPELEEYLNSAPWQKPSKYDGIYDLCIKKGKKKITSAKVGDTITVYAKVRPKYYSSSYVQLSIYICDADGNKLFDHFQAPSLMDYKITGKTISYDWTVNISDELRKRQDQPLYCYFTIYADNFYNSESIEIQK